MVLPVCQRIDGGSGVTTSSRNSRQKHRVVAVLVALNTSRGTRIRNHCGHTSWQMTAATSHTPTKLMTTAQCGHGSETRDRTTTSRGRSAMTGRRSWVGGTGLAAALMQHQTAFRTKRLRMGLSFPPEDQTVLHCGGNFGTARWPIRTSRQPENRGTDDVCMVVCDGLTGVPDRSPRRGRPTGGPFNPVRRTPAAATGWRSPERTPARPRR